jgi:ATP-binding cassette subfamily B protein
VLTAVEKIGQVTDLKLENFSGEDLINDQSTGIGLKYSHVSYRSELLNVNLLDGVSFDVNSNEKIAIVSECSLTGNALFCLTTGLYDITGGNISLDGIPISNLNKSLLREHIGTMLAQDQLVYATIFENITMGRTSISLLEVATLCEQLELSDFIEQCPDKYNTMINPEGHFIPSDVKTKLFMARIIIGLPRLILWEEPSSGMSPMQSKLLIELIKTLNNRTIIMATHDPDYLEISDKIIHFENGKIIFTGNYESYQKHMKSC